MKILSFYIAMTDFTDEQGSQLLLAFALPYILMGLAGVTFLFSLFMIFRYGKRSPGKTAHRNLLHTMILTKLYWFSVAAIVIGIGLTVANAPLYLGPIWLIGGTTLLAQIQFMLFKTTPVKRRPSFTAALDRLANKQVPQLYRPKMAHVVILALSVAILVGLLAGSALNYTQSVQSKYSDFTINSSVLLSPNSTTSQQCSARTNGIALDKYTCTFVSNNSIDQAPPLDEKALRDKLANKLILNSYTADSDKNHTADLQYFIHVRTQDTCELHFGTYQQQDGRSKLEYTFTCKTTAPWDVASPGNNIFDAL